MNIGKFILNSFPIHGKHEDLCCFSQIYLPDWFVNWKMFKKVNNIRKNIQIRLKLLLKSLVPTCEKNILKMSSLIFLSVYSLFG